jgi:Uma2 family endonuclease
MSTVTTQPLPTSVARHFRNGAEFLHSIGDVPMSRVVWDPLPGTATEQDLLVLVERDKRLCELIDGTLVEKPMGYFESLIAVRLIIALGNFVLPRNLGVISGPDGMMKLLSGRIRLPDVAYVSFTSLPGGKVPSARVPNLAPDLAAEVLSDSNTKAEIDLKLKEYFESGTKLAWIIDPPTQTVTIFTSATNIGGVLNINDSLDGGIVLPGFTMPLSHLFLPKP